VNSSSNACGGKLLWWVGLFHCLLVLPALPVLSARLSSDRCVLRIRWVGQCKYMQQRSMQYHACKERAQRAAGRGDEVGETFI